MSLRHIRKNDTVIAIAGVSSGKTGKVLELLPSRSRAVVEGLNIIKKCMRKSQERPQGGIAEKEGSIQVSNLMLFCSQCKKGVRVKRVSEGGKMVRQCRKCGLVFDK